MLSYFWKHLNLLLIFCVCFHGLLLAEEKALLQFTDNDSRGGWLSGDLIFTVPESISSTEKSAKISKYVLRWGNNPHQRLGMFLPIVSLRPTESGSRTRIKFKETRIPPGATHILLYARNENEEETEYYSLTLIDKGVPNSKPQEIVFEQNVFYCFGISEKTGTLNHALIFLETSKFTPHILCLFSWAFAC